MAVSQKLVDRLKSFNEANIKTEEQKARESALAIVAEKNAEALAKGPSADVQARTAIKKNIFLALQKLLGDKLVWKDASFVEYTVGEKINTIYGGHWYNGSFSMNGYTFYGLDIKDVYEQTHSWRRSGKHLGYRIYIGCGGGRKSQYKQMKDGSFRYDDIATELYHEYKKHETEENAARARKVNEKHGEAQAVVNDVELKRYNGVEVYNSTDVTKPVQVKIDATRNLSAAEATELLQVLKKYGIG